MTTEALRVLGWIQLDPKETQKIAVAWEETDIRRVGSQLAFSGVTGLNPVKGMYYDFSIREDPPVTIRLNVQETNRGIEVPEGSAMDADLHVMTYWHDWAVMFMGWQWGKILMGRSATRAIGSRIATYSQQLDKLRPMGDLLGQIAPEKFLDGVYIQKEML